jgi:hypothetical protein
LTGPSRLTGPTGMRATSESAGRTRPTEPSTRGGPWGLLFKPVLSGPARPGRATGVGVSSAGPGPGRPRSPDAAVCCRPNQAGRLSESPSLFRLDRPGPAGPPDAGPIRPHEAAAGQAADQVRVCQTSILFYHDHGPAPSLPSHWHVPVNRLGRPQARSPDSATLTRRAAAVPTKPDATCSARPGPSRLIGEHSSSRPAALARLSCSSDDGLQ